MHGHTNLQLATDLIQTLTTQATQQTLTTKQDKMELLLNTWYSIAYNSYAYDRAVTRKEVIEVLRYYCPSGKAPCAGDDDDACDIRVCSCLTTKKISSENSYAFI